MSTSVTGSPSLIPSASAASPAPSPSPSLAAELPITSPDGLELTSLGEKDLKEPADLEEAAEPSKLPVYTHWGSRFLPGPPCVRNILSSEACERFSWYGLIPQLYFFFYYVLNYSDAGATAAVAWVQTMAYLFPLAGGFVADAMLDKFNTIMIFSCFYVLGVVLITISAAKMSAVMAWTGMVFLCLGTGGIKPNVSVFGADQFINHDIKTQKEADAQERQMATYYNYFYFAINFGGLIGPIVVALVIGGIPGLLGTNNANTASDFANGFMIPAILIALATILVYVGKNGYVRIAPKGSILLRCLIGYASALRHIREGPPAVNSSLKPHWLDSARRNPDITENDIINIKALWRILPVLTVYPIYWCLYNQQYTVWQAQATSMGASPTQAVLLNSLVNPILILTFLPLFDRVVYPFIGRWVDPTPIRRIGTGMFLMLLCFIVVGLIQLRIDNNPNNPPSVWLQLPQIAILSASEICVSTTGLEFSYTQAPPQLKGTIMALFLACTGFGSLILAVIQSGVELSAITMIWLFVGLQGGNLVQFFVVAYFYQPMQVDEVMIAAKEGSPATTATEAPSKEVQAPALILDESAVQVHLAPVHAGEAREMHAIEVNQE